MRVFEFAKELGISTKEMIKELAANGVAVKTHMDDLDSDTIEIMRSTIKTGKSTEKPKNAVMPPPPAPTPPSKKDQSRVNRSEVVGNEILLDGAVTVQQFAALLNISGPKLVSELIKMGKMLPLSAELPGDFAEQLAARLGYKLVSVLEEEKPEAIDETKLRKRPPVVTVMGHVDHGKTTLLDAIRSTVVAEKEAGGITQHIGASWVDKPEGRIVFLDTPGHEAFTKLRARGAHVTDIVILMVAADDGVMPQTIEAINHARDAKVPIIVAINKIDKANADPDRVKKELVAHNLLPEEWGGKTPMVQLSAKKKEGINELLEVVILQSELMELKADFDCPAAGIVIESKLDKGKGPVATIIVKKGTLRVGDPIITGSHWGKIRNMLDWTGKPLEVATPSTPAEILGLSGVPHAGDLFHIVKTEKIAKDAADKAQQEQNERNMSRSAKITFDDLFSQIQTGSVKELKVILKTDVQGSLEALQESLEKLGAGAVKIVVIHAGIGAITDNDVLLASASNAVVVGFNVRPSSITLHLAEREKVEVRTYRIIYDLLNDIKAALEGLLEPEMEEVVLGQAEIRQTFHAPKIGNIAGCFVISGKIVRNADVRLIRDGIVVWDGKISALRRFKDDARDVAQGFECGITLEGYQDIKISDIIECFAMQKVE